jgi:hypothetical protein
VPCVGHRERNGDVSTVDGERAIERDQPGSFYGTTSRPSPYKEICDGISLAWLSSSSAHLTSASAKSLPIPGALL